MRRVRTLTAPSKRREENLEISCQVISKLRNQSQVELSVHSSLKWYRLTNCSVLPRTRRLFLPKAQGIRHQMTHSARTLKMSKRKRKKRGRARAARGHSTRFKPTLRHFPSAHLRTQQPQGQTRRHTCVSGQKRSTQRSKT